MSKKDTRLRLVMGYTSFSDLQALTHALEDDPDLVLVAAARGMPAVLDDAGEQDADLVLLDPRLAGYDGALMQSLWLENGIPTLGLVPQTGDYGREMYAHGAQGHITVPLDERQIARLREMIPDVVRRSGRERQEREFIPVAREVLATIEGKGWQASTLAVWSPKGGVGKTVMATNLAVALGVVGERRTLLLDADSHKANCHVALGIPDTRNLFGLAALTLGGQNGANGITPTLLREYVTRYTGARNSKLDLLVGIPKMHMAGDPIFTRQPARTQAFVQDILRAASQAYDFRVVDTGPDFNNPIHWAALEEADRVLVVITPTLTAIHDLANTLEPLKKVFGSLSKFVLVINHWSPHYGLSEREIMEVLGLPRLGKVPVDDGLQVMASINQQKPLILDQPGEVADGIVTVACNFFPPLEPIWQARGGKVGGSKRRRKPRRRGGESFLSRARRFVVED